MLSPLPETTRAWAEVNLHDLHHNFTIIKCRLANTTKIAAVLKANAYGHGLIACATAFLKCGADLLAVACPSEAFELRNSFPTAPIWVMGFSHGLEYTELIAKNIAMTLFTFEQAKAISSLASAQKKSAHIQIKIETGFHRLGMAATEESVAIISRIAKLPNIVVDGIFSHLALVDEQHDTIQAELLLKMKQQIQLREIYTSFHLVDSIGMVRYPQWQIDMVRVGAILYGMPPLRTEDLDVRPALTLKTRIVHIQQIDAGVGVGYDHLYKTSRVSRIATLSIGYSDGYMRCLYKNGQVSLHGKRAPIAGLICMDQMMIDVTDIQEAQVGDEVTLIGGNGTDSIPILKVATWAGTNRNEVISTIGNRIPRIYLSHREEI